jgi:cytochrome b subunit of formate dehydrogenase
MHLASSSKTQYSNHQSKFSFNLTDNRSFYLVSIFLSGIHIVFASLKLNLRTVYSWALYEKMWLYKYTGHLFFLFFYKNTLQSLKWRCMEQEKRAFLQ